MLHVYARYILRRQARRRVAFQGIGLIARIHSEEPPKRGLEPMVIDSLPILMYKNIEHGSEHSGVNPECAVCLSVFEDGQMIRALPNCKHNFHAECIDKWLGSQSSCPICRHEVELGTTIPPLPRESSTRLGAGAGLPSAPPLERTISVVVATEGTSNEMEIIIPSIIDLLVFGLGEKGAKKVPETGNLEEELDLHGGLKQSLRTKLF
ncbi:zinc finger, RING/FYVE/PHD-type [Artemisia annua]|uniref:RING-type E3 ubiquitin transferase n=1 Tax=Artemisia annua TaxID=35608 RepID=A0A2U1MFP0_ARTAN|nr:zinc finger, RING/FYVE/PHD-type [Artemisia annua]